MVKTLDDLANQYQTDKGSAYAGGSRHGYASIYDQRYLSKWRNEQIRLLEIGISLEPADTGKINSKFVLPEEKAYIESNIKSIEIYPDIQDAYAVAIITKK